MYENDLDSYLEKGNDTDIKFQSFAQIWETYFVTVSHQTQ